jgi:hypothetical protein
VTEFTVDNADLLTTQSNYNSSVDIMDGWAQVERYSLFGAFRSMDSNVGPNAAMLSNGGQLTDIGAWYLGRPGTGINPSNTASDASSSTGTSTGAASGSSTGKSSAGRVSSQLWATIGGIVFVTSAVLF